MLLFIGGFISGTFFGVLFLRQRYIILLENSVEDLNEDREKLLEEIKELKKRRKI